MALLITFATVVQTFFTGIGNFFERHIINTPFAITLMFIAMIDILFVVRVFSQTLSKGLITLAKFIETSFSMIY